MATTGAAVASAGLVFAFTMLSLGLSAPVILGQVGSTIGMGLLFDTLIVRSFMAPSIAARQQPGRQFRRRSSARDCDCSPPTVRRNSPR